MPCARSRRHQSTRISLAYTRGHFHSVHWPLCSAKTWIQEDVFNAALELCYTRYHANLEHSSNSNPVMLLPTPFLSDARTLYATPHPRRRGEDNSLMSEYSSELHQIRQRAMDPQVNFIGFTNISSGHYTAYYYKRGSDWIVHGDSAHGDPEEDILGLQLGFCRHLLSGSAGHYR